MSIILAIVEVRAIVSAPDLQVDSITAPEEINRPARTEHRRRQKLRAQPGPAYIHVYIYIYL